MVVADEETRPGPVLPAPELWPKREDQPKLRSARRFDKTPYPFPSSYGRLPWLTTRPICLAEIWSWEATIHIKSYVYLP